MKTEGSSYASDFVPSEEEGFPREIIWYYYGIYSFSDEFTRRYMALYDRTDLRHLVVFIDDSKPLPHPLLDGDGQLKMYLGESAFSQVVDMCRNEKPIFLHLLGDYAYISTSKEAIGEGEA
ncbi:hypothetical protein ACFLT0_00310 [Chloroflexota bacterium]